MYDMKHLRRLAQLDHLAPESFAAFKVPDDVAFKDGAIPRKYKELMAIVAAQLTQCPYCLKVHARLARRHGATEEEIGEAVMVAVAMAAGAAITHGAHVLSEPKS
ncbi:MAG: carboxymuconolactone decarboxylase family protein [Gammaproteobacteria bacterium]|nr:carboxymuconolactone decarboxylase family protein [Gammaproteobacteria bacterium]